MIRLCLFLLCLMAATCARPSDAPPVTTAPGSGLDPESIRSQCAAAGRPVPARQWRVAREDRDPGGQVVVRRVRHARSTSRRPTCAPSSKTRPSGEQDAGIRGAEDRRLLRELHERGARRRARASRRSKAELAAIDASQTKTDLARYFARMFKLNLINPLVGFVDGDAQQPDRDILYVYPGRPRPSRSRLLPARTTRS